MAKSKTTRNKSSMPSPEDAFSTKENWTKKLQKQCVGHFAKIGWADSPAQYGLLIYGEHADFPDMQLVTKKGVIHDVDSPTQVYKKLIPIEFPVD